MANQIIHKKSSVVTDGKPKLPLSSDLVYGELAINYAKDNETISLKNSDNEIVEFKTDKYYQEIIEENEEIIAASLTDLDERVSAVDGRISENNEAISALDGDLSTLRSDFDTLVSGNTQSTIESFKEVTAFLSGVTDTQSLDGILAGLATKETVENLTTSINEEIINLDTKISAHTSSTTIHITSAERTKWNSAESKINNFSPLTNTEITNLFETEINKE